MYLARRNSNSELVKKVHFNINQTCKLCEFNNVSFKETVSSLLCPAAIQNLHFNEPSDDVILATDLF